MLGSLAEKWLRNCVTDFETRPRFRVIYFCSFLHGSFQRIFFAGRNAAGYSKPKIRIFKKDPPQAPFLSVWIVSQKNWLRQSENIFSNLFFKIIIYIVISYIYYFILFLYCYCMLFFCIFHFSLFPWTFLKFKGWPWIWGTSISFLRLFFQKHVEKLKLNVFLMLLGFVFSTMFF